MTQDTIGRFTYTPLSNHSRCIRILHINPGSEQDNICGSLHEIDLSHPRNVPQTPWMALSYTWGSSKKLRLIYLDSKPFEITDQLFSAIQSIRLPFQIQPFWIDQICINQNDETERGAQVLLMNQIFSHATEVVSWLGQSSNSLAALFRSIAHLDYATFERFNRRTDKSFGGDDEIWKRISSDIRHDYPSNDLYPFPENDYLYNALEKLMKLEWFRRVWTLQEAVLAKRLSFQVGIYTLPAACVEILIRMLQVSGHSSFSSVHTGPFVRPASVFSLRQLYIKGDYTKIDAPVLLDSSKHRGVTDDHDRVYGLLGMLRLPVGVDNIQPSYSKPVEEVYMEMTMKLMDADRSPDPIKFCCAKRRDSRYRVPSWSEDWSVSYGCGAQSARSMLKRPRIYFAASARPLKYRFIPESKMLCIRGTAMGRIVTVVKPASSADEYRSVWRSWMNMLDGENDLKTLCRTLVADNSMHSEKFERASSQFVSELTNWAKNVTSERIHESLAELRRILPRAAAQISDSLRLFTIFVTDTGFMGQSCRHIEPGDQVCLLHGGKLPFVLREAASGNKSLDHNENNAFEESSTYQLIGGECFIANLADGQGFSFAQQRSIPDQDFYLV